MLLEISISINDKLGRLKWSIEEQTTPYSYNCSYFKSICNTVVYLVKLVFPNILRTSLDFNCLWGLTSKRPRPFLCQKTFKTPNFIAKDQKIWKLFFFSTSNHRILHLISMRMRGKKYKIFYHTNCKIFAFKVEKTSFSAYCGTRLFEFEPS